MIDWKKIRSEYIAGTESYREIAKRHGVSFNTLKTHAVTEGWSDLRQQAHNKATTKTIEVVSSKQAKDAVDIIDVADKLLKKITEVIDVVVDTQGIKQLSSALKDLKDIKGIKSDADMREQEARIDKLRKDAESKSEETKDITITISGDLDDFSK